MDDSIRDIESLNISIELSSDCDKYPAKQHAQHVARQLGVGKGIIFLSSGKDGNYEDSDTPVPFRVKRYFYYLSGVDEPNCSLIYNVSTDELVLSVPPRRTPRERFYLGSPLSESEALQRYDFDAVVEPVKFLERISKWFDTSDGDFYLLSFTELPSYLQLLYNKYYQRFNLCGLYPAINECRGIKDDHEIGLIKKANAISAKAHRAVLVNLRKFKNEFEIENQFLFTCRANRAKRQSYEVIAGAGQNAATLHYTANDQSFAKDRKQLVCMDAGCEWECYASDVTRTFPISGHWPSQEAEEIYYLVNNILRVCVGILKPGVNYRGVNFLAHQILVRCFLKLGIFHNGSVEEILQAGTSLVFLPHGLGHHMGLEVHDVSGRPLIYHTREDMAARQHLPAPDVGVLIKQPLVANKASEGLESGMIVTVEPGIYFNKPILSEYRKIEPHRSFLNTKVLDRYLHVGGVRIEDDILITDKGNENLTTAPKGEFALKIIRGDVDEHAKAPCEERMVVTPETAVETAIISFKLHHQRICRRWQESVYDPVKECSLVS
ncbi:hypothetical protein P152DRAFT_476406 [Eremomyces bilateralis CBS 781.70]|uniref:Xaa-Pro aminopeptidase n=1 Tax=Eremomyces bilateralis CBS 781.70 TaxID=1392243 RepID=A0A6G1FUP9_9PEZI|nr:uncharacterized protein P152DRAFT_476406 [Eremomyces bilateralis CBS 781.70]KAF1809504.1 hypothetical protein P152DRAFT_476406 [Eremomyces bilateralis CBS 781.70]